MIKVGGFFNVRVVMKGETYGRRGVLTHADDRPMIEFYDARHADYDFGDRGQFVSRYYLDTLAETARQGRGVQLDGGVPAWALDAIDLRCAIQYARGVVQGATA